MKCINDIEQWPTKPTDCVIEEEVLDVVPSVGASSFDATTHIERTYTKTWREGHLVMVEIPRDGTIKAFPLSRCPVIELNGEKIYM